MFGNTSYSQKWASALLLLGLALFYGITHVPVVTAQPELTPLTPSGRTRSALEGGNRITQVRFEQTSSALVPANCNPTGGSGGLQPGIHETNVAGVKAIVVVGKGYNPKNPSYLGFNLHGDGANYTAIRKANNAITKLANANGWVLVSPLAPNGKSWWQNPKGDQKQAFANVLDKMFAQYNVCRNIVFGTTGSGGSEFWTSQFFPAKGTQYPAHTVIACGGSGGPRDKINALGKDSGLVNRSTFYYVYGTKDKLAGGVQNSIKSYSGAGFDVRVKKLDGAGHCNKWKAQGLPTWHEWAATFWKDMAREQGVAVN
jgi:hypothetical protein